MMLPALFGLGAAGLYAMAIRVSALPGSIIADSAGQVFLGEFARAEGQSESLRVFLRWSGALFLMGVSISAAIWMLAPLLLPPVLGNTWSGTAELAQYTGLMAGAAVVGSPVQHVWTVRQRAVTQFAWNVIRLVAMAATIWIGARAEKPIASVTADLALVTVAVYGLSWLGCLWAAGRPSVASGQAGAAPLPPGTA
jgi:O-antigen/teichoic acid export membrane protein